MNYTRASESALDFRFKILKLQSPLLLLSKFLRILIKTICITDREIYFTRLNKKIHIPSLKLCYHQFSFMKRSFLKLDSWWVGLIIIALFLRLVFAAFFFHTDLKGHYMEAQLAQANIAAGYEQGVKQNTPLHYPPVIYILYNTHRYINSWMFSPYFQDWLNNGNFLHLEQNPNIFRDLLVMKLPILLFDFLTAFVLILLAPIGKKRLAGALWLLNPFSIYAIYFFGQFDIIAAFLVLSSIYLWHKNKFAFAYGILGLAAAVKVFPLLLLPVLLIYDPRSLTKKLLGSGTFALVFLICLAPIITSIIALKSVFLSNLTGGLFKASIELGGGKSLPIFLVAYFLILAALFLNYIKKPAIESVIFIILTLLLVLSDFHPQWMIWIMPLLVLLLVKKIIGLIESSIFLISYLGVSLLIDDKFVGLGTLKAVNQSFDSIPSIRFFADKIGLGTQIQSLLNAILLVCAGLFSFQIFKGGINFKTLNITKINLLKLFPVWFISLIVFLILAHIPLTYFGRLVDSSHTTEQSRLILTEGTTVAQKIKVNNPNLNSMEIRFKNIGLKNHNNINISLTAENGQTVYSQKINAGSIGDDYNFMLKFPPVNTSKDQTFTLTITQPEPVEKDEELVIPYDGETYESQLLINDQPVNGSLSYTAFYNPGGILEHLKYSLNSVINKI